MIALDTNILVRYLVNGPASSNNSPLLINLLPLAEPVS